MKRLPVHPTRRPADGGVPGRGAATNPANRFERLAFEPEAAENDGRGVKTSFFRDTTRQILARNDSPDVGFDVSVNPYRGCEHGCVYCYARPTHEYVGFSPGLDFESKILVKEDAPELLRAALMKPSWTPQMIAMSGVTDPYQPVEARLELTRRCLQVLAEFRNPVGIITKNHMVTRDTDHLAELARHGAAAVSVSVTTLDRELQRVMEPRTSTPERRLQAIRALADAGIPVRVMVAPVIPGLTDHEIPAIIQAAADAGASDAGIILLRLPHAVKHIVADWLQERFPDRKDKVLNRVRATRNGQLNDPRFRSRMRGEGVFARQIHDLYESACRRVGFPRQKPRLSTTAFRRPVPPGGQLGLF